MAEAARITSTVVVRTTMKTAAIVRSAVAVPLLAVADIGFGEATVLSCVSAMLSSAPQSVPAVCPRAVSISSAMIGLSVTITASEFQLQNPQRSQLVGTGRGAAALPHTPLTEQIRRHRVDAVEYC